MICVGVTQLHSIMDHNWREKRLYPIMGITFTIFLILFLNNDITTKLSTFPFWLSLPKMGFVGINNKTQFIIINGSGDDGGGGGSSSSGGEVKGQVLYINGWNSYWLMEESVWSDSRWRVSKMLGKGSELGLSVCRTWAFSDGDGPNSLQTSPGVFNERVFRGLDYVVVEARRNRIRLILSLVNNLDAFGGKAQYIRWAQEAGANISTAADSFFSDQSIKQYYKAYIKAVVTRKNSISGTHYYDEPAIFAWELINEPRCFNSCAPVLQAWITEMAAYIKSLDHKHLLTVGTEGFYGLEKKEKLGVNPGEWAAALGTDFIQNSAIDNIDFASVHAYPDSWIANATLEEKVNYLSHWVDSHINDGDSILKKPVLFSEIGSSMHQTKEGSYEREIFFRTIYDKIYGSAQKRQSGAGALIWQLLVEDMQSYSDQFSIVAWHHPSIYKLIREQSCRLRNLFAKDTSSGGSRNEDICTDHGP